MAKIWENRANLSSGPQHFTKFTSIFHFVWDILLVSYLFLGGSFASKLYAIDQQFWEHLKVQKCMNQHNFEMIHFKCTIPAIGCTIPVLLCYAAVSYTHLTLPTKRIV